MGEKAHFLLSFGFSKKKEFDNLESRSTGKDFPGGQSRRPPCQFRGHGFSPLQEDLTGCRATEPVATTAEPSQQWDSAQPKQKCEKECPPSNFSLLSLGICLYYISSLLELLFRHLTDIGKFIFSLVLKCFVNSALNSFTYPVIFFLVACFWCPSICALPIFLPLTDLQCHIIVAS